MPKSRSNLYTILFRGLAMFVIPLVAHPAAAIVTRHDRDDARYLELGAGFSAAVSVLPDGSGVMIAPDWVLTAGPVVRGVAGQSPRVEADGREYEVTRMFVHPEWSDMGSHDVGLLQLEQPAQGVTPVGLYTGDDEVGQQVTFVGRGDTGTGLTGPEVMDGKKRGATNIVDSADDDWVFFDFDQGDDATDLEGVSGPGDSGGPVELPDSAVGTLVAKYVEAYNSNNDETMSAFISTHFEEAFRAKRTEQEHLDLYRRLYDEHFGPITVHRLVRDDEASLTVLFQSAKGPMAEFNFEVAPGEPKQIAGIRVAVVDVR